MGSPRPDTPPEVQSVIGRSRSGRRRGGFGLCGEGPGGINFQALSEAYGYIEGGYSSVGSYVNLGGRRERYGLGKYQYMSYRADVRQIIQAKPGGAAFLKRADIGAAISSAELEQFFTPADQDSLFKAIRLVILSRRSAKGLPAVVSLSALARFTMAVRLHPLTATGLIRMAG